MSSPYIGEIRMFGGNFAPVNWAFCDGQLMAISQNTALFVLIGTTYGGDGQQTFGLPDLRGRHPVHQGQGQGLTNRIMGEVLGQENVTLTVSQLPSHTHQALCSTSGQISSPSGNFLAADGSGNIAPYATTPANSAMAGGTVTPTGGSQPHANMQPYLAISYIISLFGIFPSQN